MGRLIILVQILLLAQSAVATTTKFVAFGDAPYFEGSDKMMSKLIEQVRSNKADFVVHVGDLGGGEPPCTLPYLEKTKKLFNSFPVPFIYTPGDNDWTDCHRVDVDPMKALANVRKTFFSTAWSLGTNKFPVQQQSLMSTFTKSSENLRWLKNEIQFVTLHIVGSDNNIIMPEEHQGRMLATLTWLKDTFETATVKKVKAMVIVMHANPGFEKKPEDRKGFESFIAALKKHVIEFKKPVLLIQGDHHKLIIDHPIMAQTPYDMEWPLPNFTRLQVYGAPDIRGVEVSVDPEKQQPFGFRSLQHIVWEYPEE
ncbi:MAG: metallophosphoesterase [Bdellovibrionaceae bacterium]|jgi:hypothetical protein|nr:metallophosphoesterase [Pseudobdellovibrionaceae bacterium]